MRNLRAIPKLIILALVIALLGSNALAGGRAGCRAEAKDGFGLNCFVEQSLYRLGNLEVSGGVEYRTPNLITPYTFIGWFDQGWWAGIEIGNTWSLNFTTLKSDNAFRFALLFGVRWD